MPLRPPAVIAPFAITSVFLVAGCGGDVPPAHTPVPTAFTEATPGPGTAIWPNAQWWHAFGSPALDALITEAHSNNDDIAVDTAKIANADAAVRVAGGALLPDVTLTGGPTRSLTAAGKNSGGGSHDVANSFQATLSASYEIDFWGKNRALVEAAKQTAASARFDRETLILSTDASIADTWFTILHQQDRLRIAQNNIATAERVLSAIQARHEVGTATLVDLTSQETVVATQKATVPALAQTLATNRHALAILVGRLPENLDTIDGTLQGLKPPLVRPGLPSELIARRPDIKSVEAQLASAKANVTAAKAALYPSISLTATGGLASTALNTFLNPASEVASIGASLTQTVFNAGVPEAALAEEQSTYTELLATYHKTVLTAFGDVEDALVEVSDTAEQERLQGITVDAAQRALDAAEGQFKAGTVDLTNVLSAETTLFTAQATLADDRLASLEAIVALYQALGGGWVADQNHTDESIVK